MKKFVFTLLLVFVCHLGYAQGINGLFNEFGSEKNADCVKVSSFMMSIWFLFIQKLFFESAFNQIDGGSGKVVTKGKEFF